jgi:hypothetical protein
MRKGTISQIEMLVPPGVQLTAQGAAALLGVSYSYASFSLKHLYDMGRFTREKRGNRWWYENKQEQLWNFRTSKARP